MPQEDIISFPRKCKTCGAPAGPPGYCSSRCRDLESLIVASVNASLFDAFKGGAVHVLGRPLTEDEQADMHAAFMQKSGWKELDLSRSSSQSGS